MTTSSLVQSLAELCRERLLEEKWLLVPSLRVGHQWLESVSRAGQPAVNVHVKTLKSLALDLAGSELAAKNVKLLSGRAGILIVDRVFRQLQPGGLDYLGGLRASAGLADVLYRSVQSLRMAGLDVDDVVLDHFEVGTKGRDVQRILAAYLESLRESGLIDYADVLRLAIDRLRTDLKVFAGPLLVIVPDDLPARGLDRHLLQALPEDRRVSLAVDQRAGDNTPAATEPTDLALLRRLPRPGDSPPPTEDGTVEFFHAVGEVNEVREVLRRVAAGQIRLDEVEVLHSDVETYVPLIYETLSAIVPDADALEDDLPVTFADGIPVRFLRPGRLLAAWVRWVREDYPQSRLVAMIREGLLTLPEQDGCQVSISRLAVLLRGIGIGFGRDRYRPKLDGEIAAAERHLAALAGDQREEGEEDRQPWYARRLNELRVLRRLVATLIGASPPPGASQYEILDSATRTLEQVARTINKSDNFARQRLVQDLSDLRSWLMLRMIRPASISGRGWPSCPRKHGSWAVALDQAGCTWQGCFPGDIQAAAIPILSDSMTAGFRPVQARTLCFWTANESGSPPPCRPLPRRWKNAWPISIACSPACAAGSRSVSPATIWPTIAKSFPARNCWLRIASSPATEKGPRRIS